MRLYSVDCAKVAGDGQRTALPGLGLWADGRLIEADQLPDYAMELAETTDRSPAVQFRRRGEAEALVLTEKMRVEEERRARFDADRRRMMPIGSTH